MTFVISRTKIPDSNSTEGGKEQLTEWKCSKILALSGTCKSTSL